jgi:CheY-like chemotaxis protein/DNA-binding XRE family transcriptional regulator
MSFFVALDINELDVFLGKKINYFRDKMDWPLKTLASMLGISIQQLQRYEKGVNKISASLLYEMAKIFQIELGCFFESFQDKTASNNEPKDLWNILLVEDNPNDEFLLRRALQDFPKNLHISTLNDGELALNFVRSLGNDGVAPMPKPDLIFLDLHLPDMKGLEILKDIKRRRYLQDTPVVVLTNSISPEDKAESYHLQASGFIRKSFSYKEFKSQLHQTLTYWIDTVELPEHV